MHSSTIHRVGNTPCVTLTGPGLDITLSQGQCASIVIMAGKNGPVGRVRDAHRAADPDRICPVCDKSIVGQMVSTGYINYHPGCAGETAEEAIARILQRLACMSTTLSIARGLLAAIGDGEVPGVYGESAWQSQIKAERLMRDACAEEIAALCAKLDEAEAAYDVQHKAHRATAADRDRLAAQVAELAAMKGRKVRLPEELEAIGVDGLRRAGCMRAYQVRDQLRAAGVEVES